MERNVMHTTGDHNRMVQNTGDGNQINLGDTIVHGDVHHHYEHTTNTRDATCE